MGEKDLIIRYKEKNNLLIEEIIIKYRNYIYTTIKNMAMNLCDEDIEEIILDVFIVIWNNKEKLKDDLPLKPYIIGITKNIVKNKCRNVHFDYNIDDYDNLIENSIDIDILIEQKEKNRIIKNGLDCMKEKDRNIFILFYYNSMSISKIANKLNTSETNIKTKLHRIRKRLKKVLIERGYSYEE